MVESKKKCAQTAHSQKLSRITHQDNVIVLNCQSQSHAHLDLQSVRLGAWNKMKFIVILSNHSIKQSYLDKKLRASCLLIGWLWIAVTWVAKTTNTADTILANGTCSKCIHRSRRKQSPNNISRWDFRRILMLQINQYAEDDHLVCLNSFPTCWW